ncbi:outer membrane beta-barrel protein [Fluviicola sp.]|jgi:hypothetical protein|uniref:outer membrane beta-barrel protein n=1 Tax=Fluviicola sp. TaxID=1917219 RepID=UPI00281DB07A|nr:outer membrane beta-barrel protein [Fluviicola sp.]MDR0803399.1 PorT family protein [Fluviicola sp.]
MKQLTILTLLIFSPFVNFAQISTGKVSDPKKKAAEADQATKTEDKKSELDKGLMDFTVFLGAGYSLGSHRIEPNSNLFGKPIGLRADEKMVNRWTYQVGIRNRIHRFLSIEAGLSYDRYGESYEYRSTINDSAYMYNRKYNMLAIPVQLYFTYGKRFQFLAGAGIQPFIPLSLKTKTIITDHNNNSTTTESKTIEELNTFGFSVLFSAGLQYRFSRYISAYVIPVYSIGVTNIFAKQEPHKEWLNALNIRFGLAVHFPESIKTREPKKKS